MALEDFIDLNATTGSVSGTENNGSPTCVISEPDPEPSNSLGTVDVSNGENQGRDDVPDNENLVTEDIMNGKIQGRETVMDEENQDGESIVNDEKSKQGQCVGGNMEGQQTQLEINNALFGKPLVPQGNIIVDENIKIVERVDTFNLLMNGESDSAAVQNDSDISYTKIDDRPISGVKRKRVEYADQEPSVRVIYNSLTSASKRKLEELLQLWSKWNAQQDSSTNKPHENLVSGEETYFPALQVGPERSSSVSFWMDDDTRKEQTMEIIRMDGDSAPLYDRGFLLGLTSMDGPTNVEGGSEAVEASRCFNCSSYNHALKDCPKPRDHAAVNNARKEHNSKKNQTSGPNKATRYYESSSGGKYDGLRPGFLSPETRQLLGIGELDPPPWLHRMREIGYPPGYMDPDDEDQASGIKIYLDEKTRVDQEDGELSETDEPEQPEQKKKMSVEFPGINAPIPENADERRWASLQAVSSFDPYRNSNRFNPSPNHSSETNYRGHYSDPRRPRDYRDDGHYSDQRRSRDYRDEGHYSDQNRSRDYRDDVPPGCDPEAGISSFIPSYRSPNLGRSLSDRGRWNPSGNGDSSNQSPYESLQHSSSDSRRSGSGHKRRFTEGP